MTKGGSNKSTMLGRLIFGEKRKQHASPSRHRSATRNGGSLADVSPSSGGNGVPHKTLINLHDWAVWRMHLNEQMGHGTSDRGDLRHMRQFLHANPFYQQYSRDPSSGRYNGVRLLFSIPHPKIKPEIIEEPREISTMNKITNLDALDTTTYDQTNVLSNNDDITVNSVNSISGGSPLMSQRSVSQALSKSVRNTNCYQPVHEPMITTTIARTQRPVRLPFPATDRVHGTLQKAVKDGNVLEKIKAFEMQAAAAQAVSTPKLGVVNGHNNRMHSVASPIQSVAQRALSPSMTHSLQQSISPIPIHYEPQQQYIRSHRSRQVHPTRGYHDLNVGPIGGRQSRKGTHVLEPAVGDIILRRPTPSQHTANDDDYSMAVMSSMGLPLSQGHNYRPSHHHHHHHHHRTSVSRSRHRKETPHERRASSVHEHVSKKSQQKPKETKSSSSKTPTRHRWLKVHKDTTPEPDNNKKDSSSTKQSKNNKSKKKNNSEQEKPESKDQTKLSTTTNTTTKDKVSSDNNRVYGVPNTNMEAVSPQSPSRIDEENESDREEEEDEQKVENDVSTTPQEKLSQNNDSETNIEQQPTKAEQNSNAPITNEEKLSKVEDENRFSRPTDDHAHRSEINDEDDEYKSEGDVFVEDASLPNINAVQAQSQPQPQQQLANTIRRHSSQCSADKIPLDRRWQWSKESGGLIDKGNPKKKQQKSTSSLTSKEERIIYETPKSEQTQTSLCNNNGSNKKSSLSTATTHENNEEQNNKQISKQILHSILNSMPNNQEQTMVDEFFDNGPYTNPEDIMTNIASTA